MQTTPSDEPESRKPRGEKFDNVVLDLDLTEASTHQLVELHDDALAPRPDPLSRLTRLLAVRAELSRRGLLEQIDRRPRPTSDATRRHRQWIRAGRPGRGIARFQLP